MTQFERLLTKKVVMLKAKRIKNGLVLVAVGLAYLWMLLQALGGGDRGLGLSFPISLDLLGGKEVSSGAYPGYGLISRIVLSALGGEKPLMILGQMSAVMTAIALVVFMYSLTEMYTWLVKREKRKFVLISEEFENIFLAIVTGLVVFLSGGVFLFGQMPERLAFSFLLMAGHLLVSLKIIFSKRISVSALVMLGLVLGVAVTHQWYFLGLAVFSVWSVYSNSKSFKNVGVVVTVGLISGLLLLSLESSVSKGFDVSWYLGEEGGRLSGPADLWRSLRLDTVVKLVIEGVRFGFASGGVGLVILGVGLVAYLMSRKRVGVLNQMVGWFAALVLPILLVLRYETQVNLQGEVAVYFVPMMVASIPLLWFGMWELVKRGGEFFDQLKLKRWGMVGIMLFFLGMILITTRTRQEMSQVKLLPSGLSEYAELINMVNERAVIICFTGEGCNGLWLADFLENRNNEKELLIIDARQDLGSVPELVSLFKFDHDSNQMAMLDLVVGFVDEREVYLVDAPGDFLQLAGVDFGFLSVEPVNGWLKLSRKAPDKIQASPVDNKGELASVTIESWNHWLMSRLSTQTVRLGQLAEIYLKYNHREYAVPHVNLMAEILRNLDKHEVNYYDAVREGIERIKPSKYFMVGEEKPSVEEILEAVEELREAKALYRASIIARGAVVTEPQSIEARLVWSDLLAEIQASESAIVEYGNVLRLDPENNDAEEGIERVRAAMDAVGN